MPTPLSGITSGSITLLLMPNHCIGDKLIEHKQE